MRKEALFIFVIFIFQLFTNCKCGGSFYTKSFVLNNSSEDISIIFFDIATHKDIKTIILKPKEKLETGVYGGRGTGNWKAEPNLLFVGTDSMAVQFKNKSYFYNVQTRTYPNRIPFDDPRNVWNVSNYKRTIIEETKCYLQSEDIFTFTDEYFESFN